MTLHPVSGSTRGERRMLACAWISSHSAKTASRSRASWAPNNSAWFRSGAACTTTTFEQDQWGETDASPIAHLWPTSSVRNLNSMCQRDCSLAAISLWVGALVTETRTRRPPHALGVKRGSLCEACLRDRGYSPDDNVGLLIRCRCHDGRQLRLCPVESCCLMHPPVAVDDLNRIRFLTVPCQGNPHGKPRSLSPAVLIMKRRHR